MEIISQMMAPMQMAADFIDENSVRPLAAELGFPEDQIRLFLIWFIQFPIGWFFHFCVSNATMRHSLNILLGGFGMSYYFGVSVIHPFIMTSVSWLIMKVLPRDQQQRYVCAFVFIYLSASHIHAYVYHFNSYALEITT